MNTNYIKGDDEAYIVVVDEDGYLRPSAGIWKFNEMGKRSADDFMGSKSGIGCTLAIVKFEVVSMLEK